MKPKVKPLKTIRSQEAKTGRVVILAVLAEPMPPKPGRAVLIGIER